MMWRVAAASLALLLAAALVPAVRHLRETPPPPEPPLLLELTAPPGVQIGNGADGPFDAAVAPSGRELVFVATRDGEPALWRRPLDAARAEPLANTRGAAMPAFSPDGRSVWFFAGGRLRRLALATGEQQEIADAPAPAGVSVRGDDDVLVAPGPAGPIVRLAGGQRSDATRLRPGERAHMFPAWIGRGGAFVYLAVHEDGRRVIRLRDDREDVELRRADSHALVAGGHLLHVRDTSLVAEPLDLERRRLGSPAVALAAGVGVAPDGRGAFTASDRLVAWGPPAARPRVLRWIDVDTGEPRGTIAEPGEYWQVRLSPDERTIAVTVRDRLVRTLDVFTVDAGGGPLLRLTLALASDSDPVWSPDGRRLAFRSLQTGVPEIFGRPGVTQRGDVAQRFSAAVDEPLLQSPLDEIPSDWTREGLVFHARGEHTGFDIWRVSPGGDTPHAVARSGFNERDGRVSPRGGWLAYASDESGHFDVYVARLDGTARTRVSTAGGERPRWTAGGRSLVFLRGSTLMRSDLAFGDGTATASLPLPVLELPDVRDYAITTTGRRLVAILPGGPPDSAPVAILANWPNLIH